MSRGRKFVKPLVATLGLVGTVASIWWFALKPRRRRRSAGATGSGGTPTTE